MIDFGKSKDKESWLGHDKNREVETQRANPSQRKKDIESQLEKPK